MGFNSKSYLSTTRVQNLAGVCEKVARDLVSGGGFRRVLRFPQAQLASHDLAALRRESDEKRNSIQSFKSDLISRIAKCTGQCVHV